MDSEKTGTLIATLRKEKGMTQKQLAEILHVTDKAISRWETGKGFPEITFLKPLCAALDISVVEFLDGEKHARTEVSVVMADELVMKGVNIYEEKAAGKIKRNKIISGVIIILILLITAGLYYNYKQPCKLWHTNYMYTMFGYSDGDESVARRLDDEAVAAEVADILRHSQNIYETEPNKEPIPQVTMARGNGSNTTLFLLFMNIAITI